MSDAKPVKIDRLALAIGLGGVLVSALIVIIGRMLNLDFVMISIGVFATSQVAAIVLGIISRASPIGRSAAITSGILLAASVLFIT